MPLFNFTLRPLEDIEPWGTPPNLSLSWFGLTDGFYWIDAGGEELFRYSEEFVDKFPGNSFASPYVDYSVIRLYEDLLDLLPASMQPLSTRLARLVQESMMPHSWVEECNLWLENQPDDADERWDRFESATEWLRVRSLTSMHLIASPKIRIWNSFDTVTLAWDQTNRRINGIEAWASLKGSYSLSAENYWEEIKSFHNRLMNEMSSRVELILRRWDRTEIKIDKDALVVEHRERQEMLDSATRRYVEVIAETEIVSAIQQILESNNPNPKQE